MEKRCLIASQRGVAHLGRAAPRHVAASQGTEATRRVEIMNRVSIRLAAAGKRPHQKEGIGYGE